MRQFTTAGKHHSNEAFEGAEPITFKVDDDTFTAYPPTPTQFAYFMAAQAEHKTDSDHIAGVIDFFDGMLDEEDRRLFRRRLLDRDDTMEFEIVQEITQSLVEEWSARPTSPSSESSTSQQNGGRKSTARRRSTAPTS